MQFYWKSVRFGIVTLAFMALCLSFSIVPAAVHAQSSTDASTDASTGVSAGASLSDTIRAAILKDPRSANLSQSQIDAMVSALSSQAQTQGVTPQEIAYHPGAFVGIPSTSDSSIDCTDVSSWLCPLGVALGFDTSDKEVPIGLWITSGILIVVIWEVRKNPHLNGTFSRAADSKGTTGTGPLG
jgi:hypothetical protein